MQIQEPKAGSASLEILAVRCELNAIGGVHTGFLYYRQEIPFFCHLAWELDLRNEQTALDSCCWINVNLEPQILEFISAHLQENMDQNKASVAYDVRYSSSGEYFDRQTWTYTAVEPGLTCATFVMAIFRGFAIEVLSLDRWPTREEDIEQLEKLIRWLEKSGVSAERIHAQRMSNVGLRYRPEEVAGAVSEAVWPVPFKVAEPLGRGVRQHLLER